MTAQKLALEAFPKWRSRNPGKACPGAIGELGTFIDGHDMNDPWGSPYKMLCGPDLPLGAKDIAIVSFGPDGKEGTNDDIPSW